MRIKTLFSALVIMCLMCMAAYASDDADIDNAKIFLSQLGITDGIDKKSDENITRAEFATMTVRAMNMDANGVIGTEFSDLDGNPFASEIYMAKNIGLTNGTSESTFSPDGNVSLQVASKMLICALGYQKKAEAYGGYPSGYLRIADSLGIFSGITNHNGPVTTGEAYICVYNALLADVALFKSIGDYNMEIQQVSGRNLLTENFGLSLLEGIITTAGSYSVNSKYEDDDKIEISGKRLSMDNVSNAYLGLSARVWYDDDEDKAIAVSFDNMNNIVKVDAKDVIDFSGYTLRVDNGSSKEKKYHFDKGLTFVQNGRVIAHNNNSFKFGDGTLTLIDNDTDGTFEYVVAEKIEYFVISAKNGDAIYDGKSVHKCIDFEAHDYGYEVEVDGVKASVDDLTKDMVCEVMMSDDGEVCFVRANSDGKISGVIEEISDDAFVINGEKYEINSYFKALGLKLSPGMTYSFLTAPNGSVTAISGSGEDDIFYGFLLGFNPDKTFDKSPMVKILSSSNQKQVYELADKISLNGTIVKNTHSDIELKLKNGEYPAYQLIRYKLSNEKISMIDTSEAAPADWESADKKYMGDNTLTKYVDRVQVNYRSNIGFGVPNISFKGSVIFSVPEALRTNANANYDDELFSVISISSLVNNGKYVADAYDFDENYIPAATVVYKSTGGKTSESPMVSSAAYMIYEVTDSLNPDGDNAKLVKCYSSGAYSELYIEPQVYDTLLGDNKIPSAGDVARFTFNAKGYINGIGLDIDYNPESDSVTIAYGKDNVGADATAYLGYFGGRALSQTSGYLTIKADNPPSGATANSSNIVNLAVNPSSRYVLFNKKTKKVEAGSSADVVTAIEGGAENASLVVCKATYYYVNTVFVYVD